MKKVISRTEFTCDFCGVPIIDKEYNREVGAINLYVESRDWQGNGAGGRLNVNDVCHDCVQKIRALIIKK